MKNNAYKEVIIEPETVLDTRYNTDGVLEALVHWKGLPSYDDSWENFRALQN